MKTAEANINFPVLGFTPDREIWGFNDLNTLTSCGPKTLKDDMQAGMELIDVDGRRWVVRSIRRTGRAEPLLLWLVSHAISTPQSRIEQELDALEPVSLEEVKDRVAASIEAFPSDYEGVCDEDPEHEGGGRVATLLAQVRSATSIRAMHDLIGLDSFMAY